MGRLLFCKGSELGLGQASFPLDRQMKKLSNVRKKGRKGSLEETLSYALYKEDAELFSLLYRDKDQIKTASLREFLESIEMSDIPLTRIVAIDKAGEVVWKKGQKDVRIKKKM